MLNSAGSVVPTFRRQIAKGGPVTVTHPEMTRYFMTIPEAVSLVVQAGAIGGAGDVFVLDMGEPVKIVDLARNMIRLSGMRPDEDIKIDFVGTRPGETLYEKLWTDDEAVSPTEHPKIMRLSARADRRRLAREQLVELERLADEGDTLEVVAKLGSIVREPQLEAPAAGSARAAKRHCERKLHPRRPREDRQVVVAERHGVANTSPLRFEQSSRQRTTTIAVSPGSRRSARTRADARIGARRRRVGREEADRPELRHAAAPRAP